MNKIPYEIYKAFAGTKPTEFDSFYRDWQRNLPPEIEEVTIIEHAPIAKRKRKPKPKTVNVVAEPIEEPEKEESEDV